MLKLKAGANKLVCSALRSFRPGKCKGASAIEFALILPTLLLMFYMIVSYGMSFLYLISMNATTSDITRSSIAIYTSFIENKDSEAATRAAASVNQSWFGAMATFCPDMNAYIELDADNTLTSCVAVDFPFLQLNVMDMTVPGVPDPLISRSDIQLTTIP